MSGNVAENENGQRMIQAAMQYRSLGYRPIPISAGSKVARIAWKMFQDREPTVEEIASWWGSFPDDGIAILVGSYCNTFVVDLDGEEGTVALRALGPWPTTLTSLTGGGGRHLFFRYAGSPIGNRVGVVPGLDIRSTGGYCVVAPSTHPDSRRPYRWDESSGAADAPVADAPDWLIAFLLEKPTPRMATAASEVFDDLASIRQGARNDALTGATGKLIGAGWSTLGTAVRIRVLNALRCAPKLEDDEVARIVASIESREKKRATDSAPRSTPTTAHEMACFIRLSEVEPTTVEWLWDGYIPLGKISLVVGDPGLGKSTLSLDLAARITSGRPFAEGAATSPRGVVLLTGEDSLSDTVRPRFDAAGGVASRVVVVPGVTDRDGNDRQFLLPDDIGYLREAILKHDTAMVIIDPLMVFVSSDLNSWNDQQIRQALTPLKILAEETHVAILVITHMNKKQGTSAMYRSGGSIGIMGAVRTAFLVAEHPEDDSRRVFASMKSNVGRLPVSRVFRIDGAPNGASRLIWEGVIDVRADELVDLPKESKLDAAKSFLRNELEPGPRSVVSVTALAREIGIKERTLDRARAELHIKSTHSGFQGPVFLSLPVDEASMENLASTDTTPPESKNGEKQVARDVPSGPDASVAANSPRRDEEGGSHAA